MKHTIAAIIAAIGLQAAITIPALSDDAYGPRQPSPTTEAIDLDVAVQKAINRQHRKTLIEQVTAEGGCNANNIPLDIAEFCNQSVFGMPMGSKGD